jgi:hypothetical protein
MGLDGVHSTLTARCDYMNCPTVQHMQTTRSSWHRLFGALLSHQPDVHVHEQLLTCQRL